MGTALLVLLLLVVLFVVVMLAKTVRIVPQARAGIVERSFGLLPETVHAGSVSECLGERAGDRLHHFRMDRRRSVVVEVAVHDRRIIASPLTLSNKTTRQYFQALPILPPRFPGTVISEVRQGRAPSRRSPAPWRS